MRISVIKWTQKVVFTYLYIEKEERKIRCLVGEKGRGHDIITFLAKFLKIF